MSTAEETVAAIRKVVANTDLRRTRSRRDGWDAVVAILDDAPKVFEETVEVHEVSEEEVKELEDVGFKVEEPPVEPPVKRGPGRPPKV